MENEILDADSTEPLVDQTVYAADGVTVLRRIDADGPAATAAREKRWAQLEDDRARAQAVGCYFCADTDSAWSDFKARRAQEQAVKAASFVGVATAESRLADAKAKRAAAAANHADARKALADAQSQVSAAERKLATSGEAAWPELQKARDALAMRSHLTTVAEQALEKATDAHESAAAVVLRERAADLSAQRRREFENAVAVGADGLVAAFDQARAALGLFDHDPTNLDLHFGVFSRQMWSAARALRPAQYVAQGAADENAIAWGMVTGK